MHLRARRRSDAEAWQRFDRAAWLSRRPVWTARAEGGAGRRRGPRRLSCATLPSGNRSGLPCPWDHRRHVGACRFLECRHRDERLTHGFNTSWAPFGCLFDPAHRRNCPEWVVFTKWQRCQAGARRVSKCGASLETTQSASRGSRDLAQTARSAVAVRNEPESDVGGSARRLCWRESTGDHQALSREGGGLPEGGVNELCLTTDACSP